MCVYSDLYSILVFFSIFSILFYFILIGRLRCEQFVEWNHNLTQSAYQNNLQPSRFIFSSIKPDRWPCVKPRSLIALRFRPVLFFLPNFVISRERQLSREKRIELSGRSLLRFPSFRRMQQTSEMKGYPRWNITADSFIHTRKKNKRKIYYIRSRRKKVARIYVIRDFIRVHFK